VTGTVDGEEQAQPPRRSPWAWWVGYRRERIEAELERTRRSRVPTWAMALFLVVFVAAWIAYIALVG
jgi:type VI protein secretion system component VasF